MNSARERDAVHELAPDYESVFASLPGRHVVLAHDLTIVAANAAFLEASSGDRKAFAGEDVFRVLSNEPYGLRPEQTHVLRASLERALRSGEPDEVILRQRDSEDGSTHSSWSVVAVPIPGPTGEADHLVVSLEEWAEDEAPPIAATRAASGARRAHDASRSEDVARERVVQALRDSERRYRAVFDQAYMFLAVMDPDGYVIDVNQPPLDAGGYAREQVVGLPFWETPWWRGLPDVQVELEADIAAAAQGRPVRGEAVYVTADGAQRVVDRMLTPLRNEEGEVTLVMGSGLDVTERKRALEALEASEHRFRLLLDSTAEAIYGLDMEGRCTFVNTSCLAQLGYDDAEELLNQDMHDLIHHTLPDGTPYPKEACRIHAAFQKGETVHVKDELLWRRDGSSFRAEYRSHPILEGGEPTGAVVSFLDVSDRLRAEEAARKLALERAIAESGEAERQRLGRELHDGLRQQLLGMKMLVSNLHRRFAEQSMPEAGLIQDFADLLADANSQVRGIIHGLAPRKVEPTYLVAALERAAVNLQQWYDVDIVVRAFDRIDVEDGYVADHLYHIVHEAMTNAAKHSKGSRVDVGIRIHDGTLSIQVRDDGIGLSEGQRHNGGMGLTNQRRRAELIGAELEIECDGGTTVTCRLPRDGR